MWCCDIVGCDEEAEFYDDMDNKICVHCLERELQSDPELDYDDFEPIYPR